VCFDLFYNFIWNICDIVRFQRNIVINKRTLVFFNPLNAELNPICHLLTLLGAHLILHVARIRAKGTLYSCQILMELKSFWHIFEKFTTDKFHENPSRGSWVPCGHLDVRKLTLGLLRSYIYIYVWSTYSWCF